jgi:hypothetical protein
MVRQLAFALLAAATAAGAEPPAAEAGDAAPLNHTVRGGFVTTALRATNCTTPEKAVELARLRVEQGAGPAFDRMQAYTAQHACAVSDFAALVVGPLIYQGRVDNQDIVVVKAANYNGLYVLLVASYQQDGI